MRREEVGGAIAIVILIFWLSRWSLFHRVFVVYPDTRHDAGFSNDPPRSPQDAIVTGYQPTVSLPVKILAFFAYPLTSLAVARHKQPAAPPVGQGTMGFAVHTIISFIFLQTIVSYSLIVAPLAACRLLFDLLFAPRRPAS